MAEHAQERPETLTRPRAPRWLDRPAGYRDFESAFFLGHGSTTSSRCAEELMHWQVKIRSGFDIDVAPSAGSSEDTGSAESNFAEVVKSPRPPRPSRPSRPPRVEAGQEPTIFVRLGPFRLPEPARVIDVFETKDRVGFTYGTKPGHPITGEESFILIRTRDDRVFLVLRSVSRAGLGLWRLGEPLVRIAQIIYRRRYARALRR